MVPEFISVWHLGVGEDGNNALLVVDRLRRRDRVHESLSFEQVRAARIVSYQVRQGVKLSSPDVEVSTYCCYSVTNNIYL